MALCAPSHVEADKANMIAILEKWKAKQNSPKPVMFIINTSGGGNRSATFTMNVLQRLDSLSGGDLMKKTFLITGASGGMLGAAYFRELEKEKRNGKTINLQNRQYVDDISSDLLNSLFTSFVARDLAAPAQRFSVGTFEYVKDRGYAFEEKLNSNTRGLLNKQLKEQYNDEVQAKMPLMLFNSVITRDGRKMIICTQPVSFLMRPCYDTLRDADVDIDGVDYQALFSKQDPLNLRMLTALRMNATFPYVLPNVWLPSTPVIDVMDAGLRDNFGQETATRFVQVFDDWIKANTSAVVLLQIRDRKTGGWDHPYESGAITDIATKPMLLLQYNWFKMQEYGQNEMMSLTQELLGGHFHRLTFQYIPKKEDAAAALNFRLSKREKQDISEAMMSSVNAGSFDQFTQYANGSHPHSITKKDE
jgi:hypothetical protein